MNLRILNDINTENKFLGFAVSKTEDDEKGNRCYFLESFIRKPDNSMSYFKYKKLRQKICN